MKTIVVSIASLLAGMVVSGGAFAYASDSAPWFDHIACGLDRVTNCSNNAVYTKQPDHSFYRVQVDGKTCTIYWEREFKNNNHCEDAQ